MERYGFILNCQAGWCQRGSFEDDSARKTLIISVPDCKRIRNKTKTVYIFDLSKTRVSMLCCFKYGWMNELKSNYEMNYFKWLNFRREKVLLGR